MAATMIGTTMQLLSIQPYIVMLPNVRSTIAEMACFNQCFTVSKSYRNLRKRNYYIVYIQYIYNFIYILFHNSAL